MKVEYISIISDPTQTFIFTSFVDIKLELNQNSVVFQRFQFFNPSPTDLSKQICYSNHCWLMALTALSPIFQQICQKDPRLSPIFPIQFVLSSHQEPLRHIMFRQWEKTGFRNDSRIAAIIAAQSNPFNSIKKLRAMRLICR